MKYAIVKVNSCEMSIMFPDPILHRTFEYLNPFQQVNVSYLLKRERLNVKFGAKVFP